MGRWQGRRGVIGAILALLALSGPVAAGEPALLAPAPGVTTGADGPDSETATAGLATCRALNRRPVNLPGNIMPEIALEGESDQPWRPRHGLIRFWVRGWPRALAQSPPTLCFRWTPDTTGGDIRDPATYKWVKSPVRPRIVRSDAEGILLEANVANLPLAPPRKAYFKELIALVANTPAADRPGYGLYTALNLVPIAHMVVTLGDNGQDANPNNDLFYRAEFDIGVTSVQASTAVSLIMGVLFLVALSRVRLRRNPGLTTVNVFLRLIATPTGRASLSQLQILVWSFVIGCGTVYVMCLTGDLINITTGTLILLGISGSTSLSTELRNRQTSQAAPEAAVAPDERPLPAWADIITNQEGTELDASRVQMLFFTLIAALFVAIKIATSYTIPEIPDGFLALMGISNGVFVTSAFIQPGPRADGAGGVKPQEAPAAAGD